MTQTHVVQRQDQPIQIGPRHGYRIEGDHVFINAELQVPAPQLGGAWTLELWATEQPHGGGPLVGLRVAQIGVEVPATIGPYLHPVDVRTPARLPMHGRAYAMVLALVPGGPGAEPNVHAFANYAEPQMFPGPYLSGDVGYRLDGAEVVLEADGIFNPRSDGNLSGTLSLELWASPTSGGPGEAVRLAAAEIEPVGGQSSGPAIERRVAFSAPPIGRFRLALLLCEWTVAHGYVTRDRRDFAVDYERAAAALAAAAPVAVVPAPAPAIPAAPARAVEKLRLVPAASEPAVAVATDLAVPAPAREASPSRAARRISIQTATVDELARVKGLNLKLAQEIVKARPFTALAQLIRVRGIGEKTIRRLEDVLTV
jgi:competence ComEA-like helix-hairpin-helix protein